MAIGQELLDLPFADLVRNLASAIAEGPLTVARTADIMLGVCAGVSAAHGAGIVHRDLKPSNIFLCSDWYGRATARVLDFGISKVDGVSSSNLTQSGDIVGTSQYLSPEHASGPRHITAASDQYSLGVVLYECVTQRTPQPSGLPIYELLRRVSEGRHAPPSALRPDLPPAFADIIVRTLSVQPEDRFRSVYKLGQALFPFANAEYRRRYEDYYRSPTTLADGKAAAGNVPSSNRALEPTVDQSQPSLPAWQTRETRTSARRDPRRRTGRALDVPIPRSPVSHKTAYSVAIGAVVAAAVLGGLLLVFGL